MGFHCDDSFTAASNLVSCCGSAACGLSGACPNPTHVSTRTDPMKVTGFLVRIHASPLFVASPSTGGVGESRPYRCGAAPDFTLGRIGFRLYAYCVSRALPGIFDNPYTSRMSSTVTTPSNCFMFARLTTGSTLSPVAPILSNATPAL